MNVRHPMGVLHSFSIKNIFYGKMDLRLFYFNMTIYKHCHNSRAENDFNMKFGSQRFCIAIKIK